MSEIIYLGSLIMDNYDDTKEIKRKLCIARHCTQCVQWVHARCSRVKGSLKKVESSFICRRCKGELSETRQVNGLHIDGHEYEIVDKLCYLGDMLSQKGGCEHAILKRIQTGWLKFR